jgi:hypothetical protein
VPKSLTVVEPVAQETTAPAAERPQLQHEHDTASPIPCFNIFVARPGATQFLAAFVDGPIDPSGGLITGYASAERDGCELCFASAARAPRGAYLDFAASKYRYLHRLPVCEPYPGLVAVLRKPITEFLK